MVVRVGFLTHLLWDRYGPFWSTLTRAVGAEVVFAEAEAVVDRLTDERVSAAPGIAFRMAIAAALALDDTDLIVVPRLNPGDGGGRGAGQDPWVADLPTMLERSVPGLPPTWAVEADLSRPLETNAVTFLRRLTGDGGLARRAWSQHSAEAHPPRRAVLPAAAPAGTPTVAVVGPPWWITPATVALAVRAGERASAPFELDPAALREEGRRLDANLVDTDAEALGAVRRYARSAAVGALRMLVDGGSGSDAWLSRRALELAPQRLEVVDVRELGEPDRLVAALLRPPR
jgi:hypothetical protein